jgi:molybdenum cofactor cytidylyltransferase
MAEIGAIILAAGSGSRIGRTKQLLKIDGESLVRRTAQSAVDAGLRPIIVVTGSESDAVASELNGLGVTAAFNPIWANGIGSSIRCGVSELLKASAAVDAAVILLCDQPRLTADVLLRLIAAFQKAGKAAAACEFAGTVGPPCCFGRSLFSELAKIPDRDGAKKVLMVDRIRLTKIAWAEGAIDIDTPSDWERVRSEEG